MWGWGHGECLGLRPARSGWVRRPQKSEKQWPTYPNLLSRSLSSVQTTFSPSFVPLSPVLTWARLSRSPFSGKSSMCSFAISYYYLTRTIDQPTFLSVSSSSWPHLLLLSCLSRDSTKWREVVSPSTPWHWSSVLFCSLSQFWYLRDRIFVCCSCNQSCMCGFACLKKQHWGQSITISSPPLPSPPSPGTASSWWRRREAFKEQCCCSSPSLFLFGYSCVAKHAAVSKGGNEKEDWWNLHRWIAIDSGNFPQVRVRTRKPLQKAFCDSQMVG